MLAEGISLGRVTTILFIGRGGGYILALINSIILARSLGVQGLGEYIYATGFAAIFSLFTQMGIATVVTRTVARDPDSSRMILTSALKLQAVFAMAVLLVIPLCAAMLPGQPVPLLYMTIAASQVALGALSWPYLGVLGGHARYDKLAGAELVGGVVLTIGLLFLATIQGDVLAFLCVPVFSAGCAVMAARWMAQPFIQGDQGSTSIRSLLREATPFAATSAVQGMYLRLDVLFLGQMASTLALGLYNVAFKPMTLARACGSTVAGTLLPVMAQEGNQLMPVSFERALRGLGALAPILALSLSGLAEPLLVWTYGPEFRDAAPILVILAWAIVFNWLYAPLGTAFQGRGYERVWFVTLAVGLALNIGANTWAIPQWGAMGAAGATLFSEIGILLMAVLLFMRKFPVDLPLKSLMIGIGATATGWAVLQGLAPWGAVPATVLSVLAFCGLLITLRYLTKEDAVAVGGWFRQAVGG